VSDGVEKYQAEPSSNTSSPAGGQIHSTCISWI